VESHTHTRTRTHTRKHTHASTHLAVLARDLNGEALEVGDERGQPAEALAAAAAHAHQQGVAAWLLQDAVHPTGGRG